MARYDTRWPAGQAPPGRKPGQFRPRESTPPAKTTPPPERKANRPTPAAKGRAVNVDRITALIPRLGDDDLAIAWVKLSAAPNHPGRDRAVKLLDRELAKRERVAKLTADRDQTVRQLVDRGWSYIEAYAEVTGLDPAKLKRQEAAGVIERRKGETTRQALRRAHRGLVAAQYLQAEDDTNGHLLSHAAQAENARRAQKKPKRAPIRPEDLWSAAPAFAAKYASDELKAWWESHGGRANFAAFEAQYAPSSRSRGRAQASRGAGQGRDYGV